MKGNALVFSPLLTNSAEGAGLKPNEDVEKLSFQIQPHPFCPPPVQTHPFNPEHLIIAISLIYTGRAYPAAFFGLFLILCRNPYRWVLKMLCSIVISFHWPLTFSRFRKEKRLG
ncbi:MAG: hypothetical protein C0617_07985 [Desulfuromonas sp.]|uniref:hypothetical protein n=1 Tax=Desulfuromonas sp. TaxID=892 RepID=UPI000CC314F7|nr:hypothetical protein [Desulfuromonas sp.]PLX84417.1 MAG: hypothetical protein C0617_07985 [Desulfuromonas sp.]